MTKYERLYIMEVRSLRVVRTEKARKRKIATIDRLRAIIGDRKAEQLIK